MKLSTLMDNSYGFRESVGFAPASVVSNNDIQEEEKVIDGVEVEMTTEDTNEDIVSKEDEEKKEPIIENHIIYRSYIDNISVISGISDSSEITDRLDIMENVIDETKDFVNKTLTDIKLDLEEYNTQEIAKQMQDYVNLYQLMNFSKQITDGTDEKLKNYSPTDNIVYAIEKALEKANEYTDQQLENNLKQINKRLTYLEGAVNLLMSKEKKMK